jgi:hypothetical protein
MIGVDLIGEIRRAYFEQHRPIKEIVRTLSVSRATVRKVIRGQATEFKYERSLQPAPKLGEWIEVLTKIWRRLAAPPTRQTHRVGLTQSATPAWLKMCWLQPGSRRPGSPSFTRTRYREPQGSCSGKAGRSSAILNNVSPVRRLVAPPEESDRYSRDSDHEERHKQGRLIDPGNRGNAKRHDDAIGAHPS